jgi:hypothetical protein
MFISSLFGVPKKRVRRILLTVLAVFATFVAMAAVPATASAGSGSKGKTHPTGPHPFFTKKAANAKFGADGPAADGTTDMTYHGGSVMRDPTVYAIFWNPTTPPTNYPGALFGPNYQNGIEHYLNDVSQTPYFNILTQYGDNTGQPVPPTSHFGGSWTDTTTYPHAGTWADPLGDQDIRDSVSRAVAAHPNWQTDALSTMYMVFTGKNIIECSGSGNDCFAATDWTGATSTRGAFCAYHWWDGSRVYSYQPYSSTGSCYGNQTAYPNGVDQDITITATSHEQFEAYTDPYGDAWYDDVDGHAGENGDKCAYNYGPYEPDGSNIVLHGHPYQIQLEWSNTSPHGCVKRWGARPQTTITGDLNFGSVPRGTTATKEIALQNTGNGDLDVLDVRLGAGSDGAFSISPSTNKTATLHAGDSLLVDVKVSPAANASSTGPLTASLVIDTDDTVPNNTGQPTTAQLTATNTINGSATVGLPAVTVSGSLNFGTVPRGSSASRNVVVQNTGTADLKINNVSFSGDSAYSISPASPTSGTLAPGGSLVVEVTFAPPQSATSPGPRTGTLTISTDDPSSPTVTVPATGTVGLPKVALSPGALDFGTVCPGDSVQRELTVTNVGTAPLTITNVSIGAGSTAGLSVLPIPGLPVTLPVGAHLSFTVAFAPVGPFGGPVSGTVVVDTDDPVNPQVSVPISGSVGQAVITVGSNALDFGGVPTDNRTSPHVRDLPVTISNTGNCTVTLNSLSITGPAAGDYSIVGAPTLPLTIVGGSSVTITVQFNPTASGTRNAALTIGSNDPSQPSVNVSLTGEGLVPTILTQPNSLAYGPTVILSQGPSGYTGQTSPVAVTNTGQSELIVDTMGTSGAPFSAPGPASPPSRFAPNDHFTEPVTFGPTAVGKFLGSLTISDNDPEGGASATVPLCGEGVRRGIRVLAVDAAGTPFASIAALKLSAHGTAQKVNVNEKNLPLTGVATSCDPNAKKQYENQALPATDTLNQRSSYYTLAVTAGGKSTTITFVLGVTDFKTLVVTIK